MASNYQRTKGHNLERDRVKFWKSIGHVEAATSRAESKNADDKGIDLCNIPIIEQCKNGYARGINYKLLLDDLKSRIKKTKYSAMPIVIIHKKNRTSFNAIMTNQTFKLFTSHKTCTDFYDWFLSTKYLEKTQDYVIVDIHSFDILMTERYVLH